MLKLVKSQLMVGAFVNITFGVLILCFPDFAGMIFQFDVMTNELFRLFVSGVAVGLGMCYGYVFVKEPENLSILIFGAGLKYWAFFITLYCFIVHNLSLIMFILFGIGNLGLAMAFTLYMLMKRNILHINDVFGQ